MFTDAGVLSASPAPNLDGVLIKFSFSCSSCSLPCHTNMFRFSIPGSESLLTPGAHFKCSAYREGVCCKVQSASITRNTRIHVPTVSSCFRFESGGSMIRGLKSGPSHSRDLHLLSCSHQSENCFKYHHQGHTAFLRYRTHLSRTYSQTMLSNEPCHNECAWPRNFNIRSNRSKNR